MSSDEVPNKFEEWLLAMGCLSGQVPSKEKITEMCRGHYMVWRSLLEHVQSKDVVRVKRLQVFCDDIKRCTKKKIFNKRDATPVVPEQLVLWRQQTKLTEKVVEAKDRVTRNKQELEHVMDKMSSKASQLKQSQRRTSVLQRRTWLLQQVGEELRSNLVNLHEARAIADSLCCLDEGQDIQSKIDKCIASLGRQAVQPTAVTSQLSAVSQLSVASQLSAVSQLSVANPGVSSSAASANGDVPDFEEEVSSLARCSGDALCARLLERRARLVAALAAAVPAAGHGAPSRNKVTPHSVLAHTAALHCSLALEATKNRVRFNRARERFRAAIAELSKYLTGESCELLVLQCEKAHWGGKLDALRTLLEELASRGGMFEAGGDEHRSAPARSVTAVDKAIVSKREELKKVIASLLATESKVQHARECLVSVFSNFRVDVPGDGRRAGVQLDVSQESIATMRQFYEAWRERRRRSVDVSIELEVSDCSQSDAIDVANPRFIDELRLYLKKFKLEKNRKLVLESGEKIWIFESVESCKDRLEASCQRDELTRSLFAASSAASGARWLAERAARRRALEGMRRLDAGPTAPAIEIESHIEEEVKMMDRIKKRLNENLLELQQTSKTLALGQENLALWSENKLRKYISTRRTRNGMIYKDFEIDFLESCMNISDYLKFNST